MICTDKDCGAESGTLHLCEEHRAELKDLLDGVEFLIVNLDPNIQAGKVTKKPGGSEGGNGTKTTGSRPPTTDTAQLRYWLWELPTNAYIEARDNEHAGRTLHMARIWVGKARDAVYGPDAERATDPEEAKDRLASEVPKQLHTRALVEWLRVTHAIEIKPSCIRQWAKRGHITRANPPDQAWPSYDPTTVLIQARKEQLHGHVKPVKV